MVPCKSSAEEVSFVSLNRLCAKSIMRKSSYIQYVTPWSASYESQHRVSIHNHFVLTKVAVME